MTDKITPEETLSPETDSSSRRDFLMLTTTSIGGVGAACALWPFVQSMNPAADVAALSSIEVDLSKIAPGQSLTVMWRGKPVFIRHRTPEEITHAKETALKDLPDPEVDEKRVQKPEWLVVIGVCTHLGCVPMGQKPSDNKGKYGGWFCSCHGSMYDPSGRIRQGPAPKNLEVPPYKFLSDTRIMIG
jgi:ubiquinol-cytochrome c reductase iron-sulfur subunit